MRVTNPDNVTDTIIVTSQDTKSVSCELSNNGTLFDILSNSLYSDKVLAVIREILCNAWDSHIVNDKTHIPLEVTLDDTSFIVKDFGSGIDPEKILEIYGVYGQSTKTNDEKQVGGFGIGSKAPFAYTDTFTVTNVYKNTKSVYILTKEPNQAPLIKTVYSGITDEPTGLTVSVLLKKEDSAEYFKNKLEKFMSKTDIKIKLNGILYKNNDFSNTYCFIKSPHSYSINLYVKYNSVSYIVCLDHIEDVDSVFYALIKDTSNYFKYSNLVLNAEPNTLDISATREDLSYTQKTKETIRKLCNNFTKHITKLIENNVKDVYKNINTPKEYFEYINYLEEKYLNKNFIFNTNYISKDEDFIEYLVYWINLQKHFYKEQVYQKKIKNIVNFYTKILFSKIFNIKLLKLKREDLIHSLLINLFPNLIYINTCNTGKKYISNVNFTKVPNKVYIITNKTTIINREQFDIQAPVLLTSLKEKNNLINKLTDLGFEFVYVSAPKKEKNIVNKDKYCIYAKLVNNYTYNNIILEPNSYILYKERETSAYNMYLRPYYYENSFNLSKKIYEVYYKKDFNLLLTQGHIDLDEEIKSGKFINDNFDVKFLNQTILHSVRQDIEYKFRNFISHSEQNFELIKSKKWQTFFQKYKNNSDIIQFYNHYVKQNNNIFKKITNVKNNLAFNNLLASKDIKKIIDYKKVNQYIIKQKIEPVIELLKLIKD